MLTISDLLLGNGYARKNRTVGGGILSKVPGEVMQ
jgi:hypothetical protein